MILLDLYAINNNVFVQNLNQVLAGYFDHKTKAIFIDEKYSDTKNLFTIAHQIGHYILHTGLNYRFYEYHKYTDAERQIEYEVNNFAGKLLNRYER